LDVFENEPHIPQALRDMSNVVLTPHIGSATIETRAAMAQLAVDNLVQHRRDGTVITPVPECASLL
jgi:lactate dehydrogenase-like 2-hydroxyacid dehydrogenase